MMVEQRFADGIATTGRSAPVSRRRVLASAAGLALGAPAVARLASSARATPALARQATPLAAPAASPAAPVPVGAQAQAVEAIAYSDVAGRGGAFKTAIQEVEGRWLLYLGHLWHRGWSIMDVTDPRRPEVVNFIDGPANTWTIQMEVNAGKMITALEQMPESWGGNPNAPFEEGILIWDLADDPVTPQLLGQFRTGGTGTHRNFYAGGPLMHLAAGMPGYSGEIYVAVDISDPATPVEAGRWWVPGQHEAGGETPEEGVSLHGPPYVVGTQAFLPYGAAGLVILDIADVSRPQLVGQLDFSPPFNPNIGAHSALPWPERNLCLVCSEAIQNTCQEPLNHASVVDVTDRTAPVLRAIFPVPEPPPGAPDHDFCDKGGRFGPHNFHQNYHSLHTDHATTLTYLTYFNAGLRIYDLQDPEVPREVGWFLPPEPAQRFGPVPADKLVLQSEDVLVDARGYIYLTNKNQGLWILRYTGPAGSAGM